MSLLNKIPVLDKGYVGIVDSSINGITMKQIQDDNFKGKINRELFNQATLTLQIRCPLFVLRYLQQRKVEITHIPEKEIECYVPDVSELHTGDSNTDKEIHEHMKSTTEALILTSKAFQEDGLDKHMSQNLMPISVYNTVIASASLMDWIKVVCNKRKLPYPIQTYTDVIYETMEAEWPKLHAYIKGI